MVDTEIEDIFQNLEKSENRKKRVNSIRKGNRGESKICKILSKHFDAPFSRTPGSGMFGTIRKMSKQATDVLSGDIITPENFAWSLEIKTGYDLDLINLFITKEQVFKGKSTDKKTIEQSFIDKASRDAARVDKRPMIIYQKDHRPPIVIFPINPSNNRIESILCKTRQGRFNPHIYFRYTSEHGGWLEWIIVSLEELLEYNQHEFFFD